MFGYVNISRKELEDSRQKRFNSVYCGVCRRIREQSGQLSRLGLRYDIAFLSTLLMSLYEPEETSGRNAGHLHPITKRPWVDNEFIRYGADKQSVTGYAYEPWHIRYVGTDVAQAVYDSGLSLEEYLGITSVYE